MGEAFSKDLLLNIPWEKIKENFNQCLSVLKYNRKGNPYVDFPT